MKALLINGSPNKRNTLHLLELLARELEKHGFETEILNLADYNIAPCKGCDACLKGPCAQKDDIFAVLEKMERSDAIVIGTPTYFGNVSGLVKNLIDRSRMARMGGFKLRNRIFAPIVTSGLRHGGAEFAVMSLLIYALGQGMIPAAVAESPISTGSFVIGVIQGDAGWRSVKKDEIAKATIAPLARRIKELAEATKSLRETS